MTFEHATIVGPSTHSEIDSFLKEWAPSLQRPVPEQARGWIWCHLAQATNEQVKKPAEDREDRNEKFEKEGQALVEELNQTCQEIKEGDAPVRAKKGVKNQKQLREEAYESFNEKVKILARKHSITSGKWMFFPRAEGVDYQWSKIVKALADADGPLAKTGFVKSAKVAPIALEGETQLICVYVEDSWDKKAVGKVFETLLEDLQLSSSAFKCDANTILGIDSKHPSGIRSSLYQASEFKSKDEIKAILENKKSKPVVAPKPRTLEDEKALGLGDFDEVSDSDNEEPVQKKQKTKK
ncbi:hypothetical protein JCM5353_008206 [Sporobolomyces roseus]